MSLKESGEMYLETIYVLTKSQPPVRSIDVAEYMNFSKPSVSRGVGLLKKQSLIEIDSKGFITLTQAGEISAKKIYERHTILSAVLKKIGIDEQTAAADACRIEHVISEETFNALKKIYLESNSK